MLDGVAVVSEIATSSEPSKCARELVETHKSWFKQGLNASTGRSYTAQTIKDGVADLLRVIKNSKPLIHQVALPT